MARLRQTACAMKRLFTTDVHSLSALRVSAGHHFASPLSSSASTYALRLAPGGAASTVKPLSRGPLGVRAYSRLYPDAPRVGVGVVVLRRSPNNGKPEILLIKRGSVRCVVCMALDDARCTRRALAENEARCEPHVV